MLELFLSCGYARCAVGLNFVKFQIQTTLLNHTNKQQNCKQVLQLNLSNVLWPFENVHATFATSASCL